MSDHDLPELADLRREYAAGGLDEDGLALDPVTMFRRWLDDATTAGLHEPNAMVVATASPDGTPSARLVLLKGLDDRGFVFFTNYASRKGTELVSNPACALLFPWHDLERQVRVDGRATALTKDENARYFGTRPRDSQVGAWASPQSRVVGSRAELDTRYDAASTRFAEGGDVPLPPEWGGFRVAPEAVEFWQGRRGRMHDRLRYRRISRGSVPGSGQGWVVERLAP
ncbi:MAG: pyridoxamine 5'-phosphate oxidase [Nocardioides sp.]